MAKIIDGPYFLGESVEWSQDQDRTYVRRYYVVTDKDDSSGFYIYSDTSNFPQIGDQHPADKGCRVVSVSTDWDINRNLRSADQVNSSRSYWSVTITYKSVEAKNKKPWELGAYNVSTESIEYQQNLAKAFAPSGDKTDPKVPVVNTAGDPLFIESTRSNTLLRFDYDVRNYKPKWHPKYVGSVNKDEMTIAGYKVEAELAKLKKISAKAATYSDGTTYYKVSIEIEVAVNYPVRYKEVANMGFSVKYPIPDTSPTEYGTKQVYLDENGEYVYYTIKQAKAVKDLEKITETVPLAETGLSVLPRDTSDNIYLKFYDTWLESWTTLGFPKNVEERS